MAWDSTDLFGPWGDAGSRPSDNFQYDGGDQVNEKHFDYLWHSLYTFEDEVTTALNDIDSDGDGIVDQADYADDADASTYKGNDIDSDGDGTVDEADDAANVTGTYKGNDIDSDGDGQVDDAAQYDSTAPSDGTSGQILQTDGSAVSWVDTDGLSSDLWISSNGLLEPNQDSDEGINVDKVHNRDYKEDHVTDHSSFGMGTVASANTLSLTGVHGIEFRPNGAKVYLTDNDSTTIESYTLSTDWDITSATAANSLTTQAAPIACAFNDDGTKIFVLDANDDVEEYTLSTAYDISTQTFVDATDISGGVTGGRDLRWNDVGDELFVPNPGSSTIVSIPAGTAYDASSLSPSIASVEDISAEVASPTGIDFGSGGNYAYIIDNDDNTFHKYSLATSYDISTKSFEADNGSSFGTAAQYGLYASDEADKLYLADNGNNQAESYTASHEYTIDLSQSNVHKTTMYSDTAFSFSGVNSTMGNSATVRIVQDSTGSHSITFNNVRWPDGSAPSWSTAANSLDIVGFAYDPDSDTWDGMAGGFNFS